MSSLFNERSEDAEANEPPVWLTMEYNLLGMLMYDNKLLDTLSFLKSSHFYSLHHANVFDRMHDLRNLGEVANAITLAPLLDIPGVGTLQYLARASGVLFGYDPLILANQVVDFSKRRDLVHYLKLQVEELDKGKKSSSEIIADIQHNVADIGSTGQMAKFATGKEVGMRILQKLERNVKPYSTGLRALDKAMDGGMFPGMCYLIGGRKKMGKTTLASTISYNLNAAKIKHLYIACEMSDEEIHQRNLARATGTYASNFRNDFGRRDEFKLRVHQAIQEAEDYTVYLDYAGIPFDELKAAVAQAVVKYKIKGFVLDCLQLVGGKPNRKSQAEHQDDVGQWCATYPREKSLFSIVTAQINQTGNIRGGEGVRMACDQGYEIHAPEDDPSRSDRWLEMIETRYTPWMDVGSKESTPLLISDNGPFLYERDSAEADTQHFQTPLEF